MPSPNEKDSESSKLLLPGASPGLSPPCRGLRAPPSFPSPLPRSDVDVSSRLSSLFVRDREVSSSSSSSFMNALKLSSSPGVPPLSGDRILDCALATLDEYDFAAPVFITMSPYPSSAMR